MSTYRGVLPGRIYWSATGSTTSQPDKSYSVCTDDGNIVIHLYGGLYLSMPISVWNHVAETVFTVIHDRRVADVYK